MWSTIEERRRESTLVLRNGNSLDIPFSRLTSSSLQPLVKMPKTWIEFSREDIKIIRNKLEFNSALKKYFLEKLSAIVRCNRLICPVCLDV
jgi:ribosome recycling factor